MQNKHTCRGALERQGGPKVCSHGPTLASSFLSSIITCLAMVPSPVPPAPSNVVVLLSLSRIQLSAGSSCRSPKQSQSLPSLSVVAPRANCSYSPAQSYLQSQSLYTHLWSPPSSWFQKGRGGLIYNPMAQVLHALTSGFKVAVPSSHSLSQFRKWSLSPSYSGQEARGHYLHIYI